MAVLPTADVADEQEAATARLDDETKLDDTDPARQAFFANSANPRDAWFPLVPSAELLATSASPLSVHIWGDPIVLYREPVAGTPIALADRCPHRAAALSTGRITTTGLLECRYHGWAFDTEGVCVRVPSLPADAKPPCAARVASYPAREANGWVWVWPGDAEAAERAGEPQVPMAWGRVDDVPPWTGYVDLDIDHSLLVENFLDPAHLPFTHSTTISKASNATALHISPLTFTPTSVSGRQITPSRPDLPSVILTFHPPCAVLLKFRAPPDALPLPPSSSSSSSTPSPSSAPPPPPKFAPFDQTFIAVPTQKGHCRFVSFQRLPFLPHPHATLWAWLPPLRWALDAWLKRYNVRVLNEDYELLRGVQRNLAFGSAAVDGRTSVRADAIVAVYRRWWRRVVGAGGAGQRQRQRTQHGVKTDGVWFSGWKNVVDIEDIDLAICSGR
ncbi:hypothetical protein BDZ88DRAFT_451549 [Geranomyces variabilis]|nr:hypothetical protein BDZ88DRAFT_451549 [Geranomyces variabilis]KAJ3134643.1 hypothetical protein HDU90_004975 [Geranomyces variabilis]